MAIFEILNLEDSDIGSLRQAISDLNNSSDTKNSIVFNISGAISLASNLPPITKSVTIIGNDNIVTLNRSDTSTGTYGLSLGAGADLSSIINLNLICSNAETGLLVNGCNSLVFDPSFILTCTNNTQGLAFIDSLDNEIGANLMLQSNDCGLFLSNSSNNVFNSWIQATNNVGPLYGGGIILSQSPSNSFKTITATNNIKTSSPSGGGLILLNSDHNRFDGPIDASNNGSVGVNLSNSSYTTFNGPIVADNNSYTKNVIVTVASTGIPISIGVLVSGSFNTFNDTINASNNYYLGELTMDVADTPLATCIGLLARNDYNKFNGAIVASQNNFSGNVTINHQGLTAIGIGVAVFNNNNTSFDALITSNNNSFRGNITINIGSQDSAIVLAGTGAAFENSNYTALNGELNINRGIFKGEWILSPTSTQAIRISKKALYINSDSSLI